MRSHENIAARQGSYLLHGLFQHMLEEDREEDEPDENPAEVAEVQVRRELEQRRGFDGRAFAAGAAGHLVARVMCEIAPPITRCGGERVEGPEGSWVSDARVNGAIG